MESLGTKNIHGERVIRTVFTITVICLLVIYGLFQARNLLSGPSIVLNDAGGMVHHERTATLSGVTKNIVSLTRNGKPIFTDEKGAFTDTIVLENGYSIVTFRAQDRFGRTTTLTKSFVYVPASS